MSKRIRKMSGGLKGKLAVALIAVALLSVAFCLVFWMFLKKYNSEKQYIARITELENLLSQKTESEKENTIEEETVPLKAEKIRETEYDFISLPSNISEGDYMDIRIRYIEGSDYIVASHKKIIAIDRERGSVILPVTEEELLLLDSAETDRTLYTGTKVYVTKYSNTDENISVVNYSPSLNIKNLIKTNPNINEISIAINDNERDLLEEKISCYKDEYADSNGEVTEDYKGPVSGLPEEYGGCIWD